MDLYLLDVIDRLARVLLGRDLDLDVDLDLRRYLRNVTISYRY